MPLDQYVTLGRSGLRVSPLCLGAMTFGEDLGWGTSVEESQQIIDRYTELGGNFIDTANFYTRGHSEKILGDHIGRHAARRDRLVIATKFSGNLYPGDPNGGGSGRKSLINACENSLRRLQTDYIDLYWLHIWDANTPIEETMAALDDLVAAGKVRYIGVSDTPAWKIVEANLIARFRGWSSFIGLQVEYSLLERTIEQELVPMASEFGLGITPWSPLKSGVLSGKYTRANSGAHNADRGAMVDYLPQRQDLRADRRIGGHRHSASDERRQRGAGLGSRTIRRLIGHHRRTQAFAARRQHPGRRCESHRRRTGPARCAHRTEVRIPEQHAGNGTGHSQRRDNRQRSVGPDVGVCDAERYSAVLRLTGLFARVHLERALDVGLLVLAGTLRRGLLPLGHDTVDRAVER